MSVFHFEPEPNTIVARLGGRLDAYTAEATKSTLVPLVRPAGRLIVDLDGVEHIATSGIPVLMAVYRKAQEVSGEVVFVCARPHLRKLFSLTRLDNVFQVVEHADAVLSPV